MVKKHKGLSVEEFNQSKIRKAEEVMEIFKLSGISIATWARHYGFSVALVYSVIHGKSKCIRGESHKIAVMLGLKEGTIGKDPFALTRSLMSDVSKDQS